MTRGGISKDLHYSPYSHKLKNLTFYFSSKVYRDKFITALADYTHNFRLMLEKKLSVSVIGCEDIASVLLYKRTEKRGFYITYTKQLYNTLDTQTVPTFINNSVETAWHNIDEMFFDLGFTKVCKKGIARSD